MFTRKARLQDAQNIYNLVHSLSGDGTLLPRDFAEICENVRDFCVVESNDGEFLGCGALHLRRRSGPPRHLHQTSILCRPALAVSAFASRAIAKARSPNALASEIARLRQFEKNNNKELENKFWTHPLFCTKSF